MVQPLRTHEEQGICVDCMSHQYRKFPNNETYLAITLQLQSESALERPFETPQKYVGDTFDILHKTGQLYAFYGDVKRMYVPVCLRPPLIYPNSYVGVYNSIPPVPRAL